jgi:hypothetical protein
MKSLVYKLMIICGVFLVSSCEFDLLDSPNDVTPASADINLLLNKVQVDFADFFNGSGYRGAQVTRMFHQASDTYEISHTAVSMNGTWQDAYAGLLQDINTIKTLAAAGNFKRHSAIAKTLEAYVWMTLVDIFGDVPFSGAFNTSDFNPGRDKDADIYKSAFDLLVAAQSEFTDLNSVGTPTNDFYFANNFTRWQRFNNALQLKYHLNRRLIDRAGSTAAINALIAGNLLPGNGDDMYWRYGTSVNDPATQHPSYGGQYPGGGGDYQSNFYMWHLTEAKGFDDPRASYYFYRQRGVNPTNASEIRCIGEFIPNHYPIDMVWCLPGTRGYWGRDHLDPQGIPPDNLARTLYGLYPVGATYDNNTPTAMSAANRGASGAGIEPIMLSAFVDFMLAEAALELGTTGDAKTLLLSGITKHINFVRTWALTTAEAAKVSAYIPNDMHTSNLTRYVNKIGTDYDAAPSTKDKLRIIAREYWISLYGNGTEAYNLYRRTGQPDGMQPGQIASFGSFPRTFLYPANTVERNKNAPQKASNRVKVFWDNNPDGFIN